jgi:hypothetical protein
MSSSLIDSKEFRPGEKVVTFFVLQNVRYLRSYAKAQL